MLNTVRTTSKTKYDNNVSRAIFRKWDTINDFVDEFQEPGADRVYHSKVYAWIKAGRVPGKHAPRFARIAQVKIEDIL